MIIAAMQSKATAATAPTTPPISPVDEMGDGALNGGDFGDGSGDGVLGEVLDI